MSWQPEADDDAELTGLAGERTDLAWSRTGIAALALAATALRRVWERFAYLTPRVVVFGIIAAGAFAWAVVLLDADRVRRASIEGRGLANPRTLRAVSYGTAGFALFAIVIALLPSV
jgi:uncharacterized membrane protein YidH (DUF202 family)